MQINLTKLDCELFLAKCYGLHHSNRNKICNSTHLNGWVGVTMTDIRLNFFASRIVFSGYKFLIHANFDEFVINSISKT